MAISPFYALIDVGVMVALHHWAPSAVARHAVELLRNASRTVEQEEPSDGEVLLSTMQSLRRSAERLHDDVQLTLACTERLTRLVGRTVQSRKNPTQGKACGKDEQILLTSF